MRKKCALVVDVDRNLNEPGDPKPQSGQNVFSTIGHHDNHSVARLAAVVEQIATNRFCERQTLFVGIPQTTLLPRDIKVNRVGSHSSVMSQDIRQIPKFAVRECWYVLGVGICRHVVLDSKCYSLARQGGGASERGGKFGLRFSMKALAPSIMSGEPIP